MAVTSRDLILIGSTFLFTAFATAIVTSYYADDGSTVVGTDASERTTYSSARTMQEEYLAFRPLKVQYRTEEGTEVIDSLKGFVFSADHLDEIIRGNFHFPSGSGKMPDEVLFLLGQDGTFNDKAGTEYGNMRLTAVGMKDNVILNGAATGTLVSLFDKADPCPPNCPD